MPDFTKNSDSTSQDEAMRAKFKEYQGMKLTKEVIKADFPTNCNFKTQSGQNLLLMLAMNGGENSINNIEATLEAGGDINSQDDGLEDTNEFLGNTPLIWAVANSNVENALFFIKEGPRYNIDLNRSSCWGIKGNKYTKPSGGNTALTLACCKGSSHIDRSNKSKLPIGKVIDALVEAGADVNYQNFRGLSALHFAIIQRDEKLIEKLVEAGADLDAKDVDGRGMEQLLEMSYEEAKYIIKDNSAVYTMLDETEWSQKQSGIKEIVASAKIYKAAHEIVSASVKKAIGIFSSNTPKDNGDKKIFLGR